MSTTYLAPGLYVWDVTLESGEQVQVLSAQVPTRFASPVTSAVRGAAYAQAPTPSVASLAPPSAKIGDASFVLHVMGAGFREGDTILWNGAPEPTTLVSPTEVTTPVNMLTATTAMPIPVSVRAFSGAESDPAIFDLQPAP